MLPASTGDFSDERLASMTKMALTTALAGRNGLAGVRKDERLKWLRQDHFPGHLPANAGCKRADLGWSGSNHLYR